MTTIIGIQGDDYSLIVGDSRISDISRDGDILQVSTLATGFNKVASSKQFLIGAAGDLRAINLLHHAFVPPPPPAVTGKKLDSYMTVKFIPELRACFDQYGYSAPERDTSSHMAEYGSTIMCSVNGIIYVIDSDYSWIVEQTGLYAIGSGSSYAMGALYALAGGKKLELQQAKRVALKAIAIAAKYDPCTGAPYSTHTQDTPTSTRQVGKSGTRSIR
jgi:ATP-dependent protease HslVU (ClpYQ) peptidase subunit